MVRPPKDPRVWNGVRWLYLGAGLLFLANVSLGIVNIITPGEIPRGQILSHFHAGTIGWVTLSVIATTFWVFAGQRQVSSRHVTFVHTMIVVGLVAVAGYVMSFGWVFNESDSYWLLPLFGIPMALVIISAFVYAAMELRRQTVVTTVHLLLLGALFIASLGATMGVMWGLTYSTEFWPYPQGDAVEPVGTHAAPMDMYLVLAFAAFVELLLRRDDQARWGWAGMTQMGLGVLAAVVIVVSTFFGIAPMAGLALLAFLGSLGVYLARIGWRTFTTNPFQPGRSAGLFWGGLALPVYVGLFVYLVAVYFIPGRGDEIPHALEVTFAHVTFVGAGTNLILATQSGFAPGTETLRRWTAAGFWAINVGLVAFIASEYMDGRKDGAWIMAAGVLLTLVVVWLRLGHSWEIPGAPPPEAPTDAPEPDTTSPDTP